MIVCPSCFHQNQDGAIHCELCGADLPLSKSCPNCGASIQINAKFCGQCGFNLPSPPSTDDSATANVRLPNPDPPDPQLMPNPEFEVPHPVASPVGTAPEPDEAEVASASINTPPPPIYQTTLQNRGVSPSPTRLQVCRARLRHIQTSTVVELPPHLNLIHIGKPNERIPPDIDVAGFPHSEVISRVHADIRVEDGNFFLEDVGSSNGTYVNNIPLLPGNRHRLRAGDRVALGKGDLVAFLFQLD